MSETHLSSAATEPTRNHTWRYALYGGLASIPLTVWVNLQAAVGSEFSLSMVTVGGLLAGYLARRASLDVRAVGIRAGIIGAVPGVVQIVPELSRIATSVATPWPLVPVVVVAVLFSLLVFGVGALGGVVGSVVGGWAASTIGNH